MEHCIVDRQAGDVAERAVAERRGVLPVAGLRPALADPAADVVFQVEEVDAHVGEFAELGEDLGDELPGGVHLLDLCGRLQLDHGTSHVVHWYNYTNVAFVVLKYQPYPWWRGSQSAPVRTDRGRQASRGAAA